MKSFVIRDPKTRKISKSDFRDRVVHHALCNIIEPMFDKGFIHDSYANRIGKGTFAAIERFEYFKRKVSKNDARICFVLKADVKHYFDTVDHDILISILKKKIKEEKIISLIRTILDNHKTNNAGKGMPLGNLTSQFFANVYLNELDQFVKHKLKAKFYIRYVDDFVIFHHSKKVLNDYKTQIDYFLKSKLSLELHPEKSRILKLSRGISFLGFRIFSFHKLVRKNNLRRFGKKFQKLKNLYTDGIVEREKVVECLEGWLAYVSHANTYKYRKNMIKIFNQSFPVEETIKFSHVKKHQNFLKKIYKSDIQFSVQKTLQLLKKGLKIKEIAQKRSIKESTVWEHLARLIEYNQLSLWKILPRKKINKVLYKIHNHDEKLKEIKARIKDNNISFDEINCVLAFVKSRNRERNICHLINWYKRVHCRRKCYSNNNQLKECSLKLDYFIAKNPKLEMTRKEFLHLFNNHMKVCILSEKEKRRYVTWKEFKSKAKIQ